MSRHRSDGAPVQGNRRPMQGLLTGPVRGSARGFYQAGHAARSAGKGRVRIHYRYPGLRTGFTSAPPQTRAAPWPDRLRGNWRAIPRRLNGERRCRAIQGHPGRRNHQGARSGTPDCCARRTVARVLQRLISHAPATAARVFGVGSVGSSKLVMESVVRPRSRGRPKVGELRL